MPTVLTGENGAGEEEPDKKSKERREKDRKALRMRRINSLKRQISIKEKMLEVSALQLLIVYFCPPQNPELHQRLTFLIIAYTLPICLSADSSRNVSTHLICANMSKLGKVESNCNSFQQFSRELEAVCGTGCCQPQEKIRRAEACFQPAKPTTSLRLACIVHKPIPIFPFWARSCEDLLCLGE